MEAASRTEAATAARAVNYIAVEGVIGAGKTSLARQLAAVIGGFPLLEVVEENPFLPDFYRQRRAFAFQTQIFFLLSRYRQQRPLLQRDLFHGPIVSDYMFEKDRIFANINLDDHELDMYNQIFGLLERELPRPDRVIFLQAGTEMLLGRIERRGRVFERDMDPEYLEALAEAYAYFFKHYAGAPVLVVNVGEVDFLARPALVADVWRAARALTTGIQAYHPPTAADGLAAVLETE